MPLSEETVGGYNPLTVTLTKVGDFAITYDAIGNPISVHAKDSDDTYDYGYNMTWNGRELLSYTEFDYLSGSNDQDTVTYTYNADGIRTSKTVNGIEHKYIVDGSRIVAESWTENGVEHFLVFIYDEMGAPIALKYRAGTYAAGTFDYYFFEKNIQGDVIAIHNANGTKIGSYTYDAWGNFTVTKSSGITLLEYNILYNYNPFHYRGYYYDAETGFYYLQSRYYNLTWGRFLNADACLYSNILGFNLLAYCYNNPITYIDQYGESATAALGWWASTFWIPAISEPTIVGEILYGAGCAILGIGVVVEGIIIADKVADIIVEELDPEPEPKPKDPEPEPKPKDNTSTEKNTNGKKPQPEPPNVEYPGDDPTKSPNENYEWRGKPPQGGREGGYANKNGDDSYHPDLNHPDGVPPHWDYNDGAGHRWRIFPDHIEFVK